MFYVFLYLLIFTFSHNQLPEEQKRQCVDKGDINKEEV